MLDFLATFGNYVTAKMGIDITSQLGKSVSFFIEDTIKIFALIYIMLFIVSLFRAQLSPEKIKQYLSGKSSWYGYMLAVILGTITPFCTCSSIPMFIGFTAAGIPFGMTMAFLIASPLISEIAAALLLITPQAGPIAAILYVIIGSLIAIIGGYLCDHFGLEKYKHKPKEHINEHHHGSSIKDEITSLFNYAHSYATETVKEIAPWVFIGLIVGAIMHGYIPEELFSKFLGAENPFAVLIASIAGIPIYANHDSVLPIVQVLLQKGVPIGTTLVMLMSITGISLPEIIILHKVLDWKILKLFIIYLLLSFISVGYILNMLLV